MRKLRLGKQEFKAGRGPAWSGGNLLAPRQIYRPRDPLPAAQLCDFRP